jgi:hypothetical protein
MEETTEAQGYDPIIDDEWTRLHYDRSQKLTNLEKWAKKRKSNVIHVEAIQVIRIISHLGLGTKASVARNITEYYTMEGKLIGRDDPFEEQVKDD